MPINNNKWNKIRYTFYTPFYDLMAGFLRASRKKSIHTIDIKSNEKVLIIGAGTGLDLEFLPSYAEVTATDITPSMIVQVKKRAIKLNMNVNAQVMDGQVLEFADESFDYVILHLILAVIPDPYACLKEAERVLKNEGNIVVFDKFVHKGKRVSVRRRWINVLSNLFFTNITRSFETILLQTQLTVMSDKDAMFNGNFRLIKLKKA